jgi:hypothetical protein
LTRGRAAITSAIGAGFPTDAHPEKADSDFSKEARSTCARLLRKFFEIDPLVCKCGAACEKTAPAQPRVSRKPPHQSDCRARKALPSRKMSRDWPVKANNRCSKVNRGVLKSEQTAFLAVAYHVGEKAKGLSCGPVCSFSPNASLQAWRTFYIDQEINHHAHETSRDPAPSECGGASCGSS